MQPLDQCDDLLNQVGVLHFFLDLARAQCNLRRLLAALNELIMELLLALETGQPATDAAYVIFVQVSVVELADIEK